MWAFTHLDVIVHTSKVLRDPNRGTLAVRRGLNPTPPARSAFLIFPSRSLYAQVASKVKICASLTPMLSAVERLHLCFDGTRWWFPHDRHLKTQGGTIYSSRL